jgi:gamma-glutamyltranspeptidase/glutathione hydrolase
MSTRAMVATSQPLATAAGIDILRRGGNAMDAAIAAGGVLCVTEPRSTGIGGDCFILYHEAASNTLHGLNGSGRAPAAATPQAIRGRGHTRMPERGLLSVTVPGAVHAWETALSRFGSLGLATLLQPALEYAQEGYAVSPVVADTWRRDEVLLASDPVTGAALLVDGRAPAAGHRHRQPALARSMRLIADHGAQVLYKGELAEEIARFSQRQGGLLALEDLAYHRSQWVRPICTDYGGLRVYEIPPNGQGIAVLMMLNILRHAALAELEPLSAAHIHTMSEAFSLAAAEAAHFVCDPEFADVPVARMLAPEFARRQWSRIDPKRALRASVASATSRQRDTVYLTVVDKERNVASYINSLYYPWGCGLVAGETGVVLQNRGAGFVLEEGHPNCVAPRKRSLHTILPAIAYEDERPLLSFGVMGGQYQPMGQCFVLTNWLDFGMDLQQAVDAPRFMPSDGVLTVERGIGPKVREALRRLGHQVAEARQPLGGGQCIYLDHANAVLQAASDPRKDGCALGY